MSKHLHIAYVLYSNAVISGKSNGIRSQALTWSRAIRANGGTCTLVNSWEHYDWSTFDAIHIFGYDLNISTFVTSIAKKNSNIYLSPIIDSQKPYFLYKLATLNGIGRLRLYSQNYALREAIPLLKGICVRSEHEGNYLRSSFGADSRKIFRVPLSYGMRPDRTVAELASNKKKFCLHVSSLYQSRKNVVALVSAAKKYQFELVLAGSTGTEEEFKPIRDAIGSTKNIQVAGFVSKEALIGLYEEAKVFALPSKIEGVGIAALDAAMFGCNIALTNIKGPKEYFPRGESVQLVNPLDVDDIGQKIVRLLSEPNHISLAEHITSNYCGKAVARKLLEMYESA